MEGIAIGLVLLIIVLVCWVTGCFDSPPKEIEQAPKAPPHPTRYLTVTFAEGGAKRYLNSAMYSHRISQHGDLSIVAITPYGEKVIESFATEEWTRCEWLTDIEFDFLARGTAALFQEA